MKTDSYRPHKTSVPFVCPVLLYLCILLAGCTLDEVTEIENNAPDKKISVTICLPEIKASTKALSTKDEINLESIQILLFEAGNGAIDQQNFVTMRNITKFEDTDSASVKKIMVTLPRGNYNMLFMANAYSWLINNNDFTIKDGVLSEDMGYTFGDIRDKLTASITDDGTGWNNNPSTPFYHTIPMCCPRLQKININQSIQEINYIGLERILAKVDIKLTGVPKEKFELKKVRVYNYNTQSYLLPPFYNTPAATKTNNITPLYYYPEAQGTTITNKIYLFESLNKTVSYEQKTCLVVAGIYKESKSLSYYRIDFRETIDNSSSEHFDITRNTHFEVEITDVKDEGWPDENLAFNGKTGSIEVKINSWESYVFPDDGL